MPLDFQSAIRAPFRELRDRYGLKTRDTGDSTMCESAGDSTVKLVRSGNVIRTSAGGRDVLLAMRERLGLTEPDLRWSAVVLREFGNLSSPFVLFVLKAALADDAPGGLWWMSSFGAGFSCHGALLEVE